MLCVHDVRPVLPERLDCREGTQRLQQVVILLWRQLSLRCLYIVPRPRVLQLPVSILTYVRHFPAPLLVLVSVIHCRHWRQFERLFARNSNSISKSNPEQYCFQRREASSEEGSARVLVKRRGRSSVCLQVECVGTMEAV
eukprot:132843-Rhodomonas_salina.2